MNRPAAKGWCPSAYHPMESGDGWILRIRPILARLTSEQAHTLCDAAAKYGSGIIDLTSRANLQIRGVRETKIDPLLAALAQAGLIDPDPEAETKRNILTAPDWHHGDITHFVASELSQAARTLPDLPAKFGFAVDCGRAPILSKASADIRLERSANGLIVRADGATTGREVTRETAAATMIALAVWFLSTGGSAAKRMSRHLAQTDLPDQWLGTAPLAARPPVQVGGAAFGVPFGQLAAADLQGLIAATGATALRITPWRVIVLEGANVTPNHPKFISQLDDPRLLIQCCAGAPFCAAATVETRALAAKLIPRGPIHISGCAKGCANPKPETTTLVGREGRFDLVKNGTPWDEPCQRGLDPSEISAMDLT